MVMFIELRFHCIVNLMRIIKVHGQHAQRVAYEIRGEVILKDARVLLKDVAFLWIFDVCFND